MVICSDVSCYITINPVERLQATEAYSQNTVLSIELSLFRLFPFHGPKNESSSCHGGKFGGFAKEIVYPVLKISQLWNGRSETNDVSRLL